MSTDSRPPGGQVDPGSVKLACAAGEWGWGGPKLKNVNFLNQKRLSPFASLFPWFVSKHSSSLPGVSSAKLLFESAQMITKGT